MSETHGPSPDDHIARHFAGRFVRRDEKMWFDMPTAREVVKFCVSQEIAVVCIDEEWDSPEGRQRGIYDNRTVLPRSLTWPEVVETCAERAQMFFATWTPEQPGFGASFTYYTEADWQEQYA